MQIVSERRYMCRLTPREDSRTSRGRRSRTWGKEWVGQTTPSSPQISPGPAPACGSHEIERVGHCTPSSSCPTYRGAFPSSVWRAFTRTSLEPHCPDCLTSPLPGCFEAKRSQWAVRSRHAKMQASYHNNARARVRSAPGWPSPAVSTRAIACRCPWGAVCPPMTTMRGTQEPTIVP